MRTTLTTWTQLASDRTSCRSPLANQVRLVLQTGAYWLMLKVRDAIPRPQPLATAEFTTLRMRLIKIAARIVETASRVRVAFAAAHPEAALFASLARCLQPAGPRPPGHVPRYRPIPPITSAWQICSELATKERIGGLRLVLRKLLVLQYAE